MSDDNDHGMFFIGGPEDMPEELKEAVQQFLSQMSGGNPQPDLLGEVLTPTSDQFSLVAGDYVSLIGVDDDGQDHHQANDCGQVVDPAQHSEQFPNWEEQLMQSYLLVNAYLGETEETTLGWWPRAALIKLDKDQFDQMREWRVADDAPFYPPAWLIKLHIDHIHGVNKANPGKEAPKPMSCITCGSEKVYLWSQLVKEACFLAGEIDDESPDHLKARFGPGIYSVAHISSRDRMEFRLRCEVCGASEDPREWGRDVWVREN
jgi:hypothetical protein